MWTLPDIPGCYPVGATTFAAPVGDGHIIGTSKLKPGTSSGGTANAPALVLKEVAFTIYYPADITPSSQGVKVRKGTPWVTSPAKEMLRGYAKFAGLSFFVVYWILGWIAMRLKIPVYPNARLLSPSKASNSTRNSWPLVIFSHGLWGTRTNYSHFCSRLASQGYVVLAIEHKDGSAPFTMARSPIPGDHRLVNLEYRYYLNPDDTYWDDPAVSEQDTFALRTEQLLYRRMEVYLAYVRFKDLIQSMSTSKDDLDVSELHTVQGPWNFKLKERMDDLAFWKSWMLDPELSGASSPKVECNENVHLAGHSFGGATVLSILSQPPPSLPKMDFSPLPVSRAIVLDPWLEPLPSPGPTPWQVEASLKEIPRPTPKLLLLNSEGFTLWDDHFTKLKELVDLWKQPHSAADRGSEEFRVTLLSLIRATHMSFSDVGVLFPWGQTANDSQTFLNVITELSSTFLESINVFERTLKGMHIRDEEIERMDVAQKDRVTKWSKRFVGGAGDIIIHV